MNYLELLRTYLICLGQITVQAFQDPFSAAARRPCRQPPRAGRAGNRRGPAVPAAAVGRPCRQQQWAGRAGSHRGAAGQEAPAGRAGSRGPTCAGQSIVRRTRRSRSPPGTASPSASQPCRRKEGVAWGEGVGGVSWDYALSPIRGTCGRGPFAACTGSRVRTGTS